MKIRLEYIYNSGYKIETEDRLLIIDYYKGDLEIREDREPIFLVSHHHYDHYNKKIFNYRDRAKYVLSFDIDDVEEEDNIYFLNIGDQLDLEGIRIKTLGSTDEGSSFLIEFDGIKIFHAGDLNWWAWEDQGEKKEEERERDFKKEIDKLEGEKLDIVMGVVDPRLDKNYYLGGEYIIEKLKPTYFFPMHFKEDYSRQEDFKKKVSSYPSKVFTIDRPNQVFELDIEKD